MMPNATYSYDASSLDSPYLRSTNFYGFDKPDADDKDRWTDKFGEFKWPFLTSFGIGACYYDNVLLNDLDRKGSFGTTVMPSATKRSWAEWVRMSRFAKVSGPTSSTPTISAPPNYGADR